MNKESVRGARALYYGFLSKMLVFTPDPERFEGIEDLLEPMLEYPLDTNSLEALKEIRDFLDSRGVTGMIEEYDEIFHNPELPVVRTTASFYHEGVESGRKLLEVRQFLAKTRIRRDEKRYKEPEDSIGFLMAFMHELVRLTIEGHEEYEELQRCLFAEVLNPFLERFVPNLYEHPKAEAYGSLAVLLYAFLEFERLYFQIPKPIFEEEETGTTKQECVFVADAEAQRRQRNRIEKSAESLVKSCALDDSSFEDELGLESPS